MPRYFDTKLLVWQDGNPLYTPAMLTDLVASIKEHGQLVPEWVCPSPDLPPDQRILLDGHRRAGAAEISGTPFWAFDLGRFVSEQERIVLTCQNNECRRTMSRNELAQLASRYMELTSCTAAEAAKQLNVSAVKLSRAFGDRRIPAELRPRAELLGMSIRSLIAATPAPLMPQALEFAERAVPKGGRRPGPTVAVYPAVKGERQTRSETQNRHSLPCRSAGGDRRECKRHGHKRSKRPHGHRGEARQARRGGVGWVEVPVSGGGSGILSPAMSTRSPWRLRPERVLHGWDCGDGS